MDSRQMGKEKGGNSRERAHGAAPYVTLLSRGMWARPGSTACGVCAIIPIKSPNFLVRIEPFQGLAPTPTALFLLRRVPPWAPRVEQALLVRFGRLVVCFLFVSRSSGLLQSK